ncbi:MAG: DUF951 domain-containing protein [Clostridia bacterium]|nr:DUF951 domain-containing protein [Clostridia bacterium]
MTDEILRLFPEDRLELKKPHPCGGRVFRILRAGSDVRILCETCGRDMMLDRIKLEKAVKRKLPTEETKTNE